METLFERYYDLNIELNKQIAQLLDVPFSAINDYFPSKLEFNAAIWHYFPVTPEMTSAERDGFINGMHEHRDPASFLTCLIQSRPGLQVQNHVGKWIDVPMVEGAVVCNIGESSVFGLETHPNFLTDRYAIDAHYRRKVCRDDAQS